ncbi:MAG: hypothetical protein ACFFDT_11980, partial [Candidatus Hodarchaeota archaeon]
MRRSIILLVVSIVILAIPSSCYAIYYDELTMDRNTWALNTIKTSDDSTNYRVALSMVKTVNPQDIYVNLPFLVLVTVKNFGNTTAFNLTLTEDFFPDYLFNVTGPEKLTLQEVANGSISYYSY